MAQTVLDGLSKVHSDQNWLVIVKDHEPDEKHTFINDHIIQKTFASFNQPKTQFKFTYIGKDIFAIAVDKESDIIEQKDLSLVEKLNVLSKWQKPTKQLKDKKYVEPSVVLSEVYKNQKLWCIQSAIVTKVEVPRDLPP